MAAADITKAMIATFYGTNLAAATLEPVSGGSSTVDCRGKWIALRGDDGGTPKLIGIGDSLEQLEAYIGATWQLAVSEGTAATVVHWVPQGMG